MPIFAVSDLHLSTDGRKSMDPFRPAWRHHPKPLFAKWDALVPPGADLCVFGHLHTSDEQERVLQGEHNGVVYRLVGCDALGMVPAHLGDMSATGLTLADPVAAHPRA